MIKVTKNENINNLDFNGITIIIKKFLGSKNKDTNALLKLIRLTYPFLYDLVNKKIKFDLYDDEDYFNFVNLRTALHELSAFIKLQNNSEGEIILKALTFMNNEYSDYIDGLGERAF